MKSLELDIGDLVICKYDFEELYYPFAGSKPTKNFFIGIIANHRVHVVYPFNTDIVYDVLCSDGNYRNFMRWEIEVLVKVRK